MRITNLTTMVMYSLFCVFTATYGETQPPAGAISIVFETQEDLVLHEPVLIQLTIENRLEEQIEVGLGTDRKENLRFLVTRPDGRVVEPQAPVRGGISRIGRVRIAAKNSFSQQYVLDEWMTFDELGMYEVRVELQSPFVISSSESLPPAEAQTLHVSIKPRDEFRLREISENFARIAIGARSYETRSDAALALSYVTDPVAIPYMSSVLAQTDMLDTFLVKGLVRQGTELARAELIELSEAPDEERSAIARNALSRFEIRQ